MKNAAATKTLTINEVFRTLVGTRSECLAQLEELFAAGKVDTKTFREAEAFYTAAA
jgi:alkanesulfonate monooxygenase SsuD/methylene tetrahydromethanopterin reductase-like flavin-dependent oxidoreductase (luciferase family)